CRTAKAASDDCATVGQSPLAWNKSQSATNANLNAPAMQQLVTQVCPATSRPRISTGMKVATIPGRYRRLRYGNGLKRTVDAELFRDGSRRRPNETDMGSGE